MSANGWLLSLNGRLQVAVGARELIYVLPDEPQIYGVPLAPPWAPGVIIWEDRLVPAIDAGQLLQGDATPPSLHRVAAIVAFSAAAAAADHDIELGALLLRKVPAQLEVGDDQACELPAELNGYNFFSSCFEQAAFGPVPILNLEALFTGFQQRLTAS